MPHIDTDDDFSDAANQQDKKRKGAPSSGEEPNAKKQKLNAEGELYYFDRSLVPSHLTKHKHGCSKYTEAPDGRKLFVYGMKTVQNMHNRLTSIADAKWKRQTDGSRYLKKSGKNMQGMRPAILAYFNFYNIDAALKFTIHYDKAGKQCLVMSMEKKAYKAFSSNLQKFLASKKEFDASYCADSKKYNSKSVTDDLAGADAIAEKPSCVISPDALNACLDEDQIRLAIPDEFVTLTDTNASQDTEQLQAATVANSSDDAYLQTTTSTYDMQTVSRNPNSFFYCDNMADSLCNVGHQWDVNVGDQWDEGYRLDDRFKR